MSHFGVKTGIDLAHYGLKLGMFFKGTTRACKRFSLFNSFLSSQERKRNNRNILVIRDSQVLAKLVVVTIFFIGWGQTARLQRVRQNTADRIQTETEQQQTARLQRVRQNTADRILKFDKRYKAFEIAGYFQKHREIIG